MPQHPEDYPYKKPFRYKKIMVSMIAIVTFLLATALYLPGLITQYLIMPRLMTSQLQEFVYDNLSLDWQSLRAKNVSFKSPDKKHTIKLDSLFIGFSPRALWQGKLDTINLSNLSIDYTPSPTPIPPIDEAMMILRDTLPLLNNLGKIEIDHINFTLLNTSLPAFTIRLIEASTESLKLTAQMTTAPDQQIAIDCYKKDNQMGCKITGKEFDHKIENFQIKIKDIDVTLDQQDSLQPTNLRASAHIQKAELADLISLIKPLKLQIEVNKTGPKASGALKINAANKILVATKLVSDEATNALTTVTMFNKLNLADYLSLSRQIMQKIGPLKDLQKRLDINGAVTFEYDQLKNSTLTITTTLFGGTVTLEQFKLRKKSILDGLQANVLLKNIDLDALAKMTEMENLNLTGSLSGMSSIFIDQNGVDVLSAKLTSAQSNGRISYNFGNPAKKMPAETKLAMEALQDLRFSELEINLSPSTKDQDDLQATIKLRGSNPQVLNGYPFEFNIQTTGKLRDLLKNSLNSFTQPQNMNDINKKYGAK